MSRFCIDCGKPISQSAARIVPAYSTGSSADAVSAGSPVVAPAPAPAGASALVAASSTAEVHSNPALRANAPTTCPKCAKSVAAGLPFCGHCGTKVTNEVSSSTCWSCGNSYTKGIDLFCARCGTRVGERVSVEINNAFGTLVMGAKNREIGPKLALLNESGDVTSTFVLDRGEAVVGRGEADIKFDDVFLSPLHARFELRDGELWVRDLGSRNGTWTFIDAPTRLVDSDLVLVGSQLIRFRRLGYPGPHPPEADATRRMGSLIPSADVAVLEQLRADSSVRDTFHLSPARVVLLGRESGDWVFPYDQTMSGRHAEVRSQDSEFFVHDAGSRNGVAIAVRGERQVKKDQRILVGDQVLRVESLGL
jgi:pSer/pThr/pTyr-binding forkhead associated (FHA) protein